MPRTRLTNLGLAITVSLAALAIPARPAEASKKEPDVIVQRLPQKDADRAVHVDWRDYRRLTGKWPGDAGEQFKKGWTRSGRFEINYLSPKFNYERGNVRFWNIVSVSPDVASAQSFFKSEVTRWLAAAGKVGQQAKKCQSPKWGDEARCETFVTKEGYVQAQIVIARKKNLVFTFFLQDSWFDDVDQLYKMLEPKMQALEGFQVPERR